MPPIADPPVVDQSSTTRQATIPDAGAVVTPEPVIETVSPSVADLNIQAFKDLNGTPVVQQELTTGQAFKDLKGLTPSPVEVPVAPPAPTKALGNTNSEVTPPAPQAPADSFPKVGPSDTTVSRTDLSPPATDQLGRNEPFAAATFPRSIAAALLLKARQVIQKRREKKLDKVMTLFLKKNAITNDDLEKLLHVSDATATRYLSELVKQGRIRRDTKLGSGVRYVKI